MNIKLLASIVFVLLTGIVASMDSVFAAEYTKKDTAKEKVAAKKDASKEKIAAKKDDTKKKMEAKKDATKEKVAAKKEEPKSTGNTIEIAKGSSSPGCDATSSCYLPNTATVKSGSKVVWKNADSAAHTVTSGSPTNGPDGNFDSGMIMAGKTFSYTIKTAGVYSYYCAVHPWMTGTVTAK